MKIVETDGGAAHAAECHDCATAGLEAAHEIPLPHKSTHRAMERPARTAIERP